MTAGLIRELDDRIQQRSLLKHPFYQRWQAGTLPLEALRSYACQYYRFETAFPTFLSALHARCTDLQTRQAILHNLWDEEHGERNHRALWLQFCRGIGVATEEVEGAEVFPETRGLVSAMGALTGERSVPEGLAALYAYERQLPAVAEQKALGLRRFYGIQDEATVEFFTLHAELDKAHASHEAEAILRLAPEPEAWGPVMDALEGSLEAWWRFLDGIPVPEGAPA